MRNAEKRFEERQKGKVEESLQPGKEVEEESHKSSEERSEEKMEELSQEVQGVEKECEEKTNAIKHLFSAEINAQSISIASVKEKNTV